MRPGLHGIVGSCSATAPWAATAPTTLRRVEVPRWPVGPTRMIAVTSVGADPRFTTDTAALNVVVGGMG